MAAAAPSSPATRPGEPVEPGDDRQPLQGIDEIGCSVGRLLSCRRMVCGLAARTTTLGGRPQAVD